METNMKYDYEVTVGPPALPYPEPEPVAPAPTTHRHLALVSAIVGVALALMSLAVVLWWIHKPPNNVDAAPTVAPTQAIETPTPPETRWLMPELPDAAPAESVDDRYLAVLKANGIGPGLNSTRADMLQVPHEICQLLYLGWSKTRVEDSLQTPTNQITAKQAKVVIDTAVELYCPDGNN